MKKRSRKEANLYKEPSSDLSDLDSDNPANDVPQEGRRQKNTSKRAKFAAAQNEESKEANSGKTYGKC